MPKTRKNKCTDGKRHHWKDGWICEKCGLRRVEYEEAKLGDVGDKAETGPKSHTGDAIKDAFLRKLKRK
jgi:hypothetical protein